MPVTGRSASDNDAEFFIPEHELIRPIAAGAYGEVWLARNAVGTLRAVKIVRRDQHASVETFEREFRGLQRFEPVSRTHENLVDILTLGLLPENAGFYYAMELADSVPINQGQVTNTRDASISESEDCYIPRTLRAELKARGALPADEVIALGLKLTAALAHLHGHGLVHRDVKPSNILFIGGEPKLADAGLVAAMDDARSLVGTAGYIAPEGPGTAQADLYALGKVFYEAAFGKDRQEFPALPTDVANRSDHALLLELNCILLKACATQPRDRYQSAIDLNGDLELFRAGASVKRRHAWQSGMRHVRASALGGIGLIGLTLALYLLVLPSRPRGLQMSSDPRATEEYREGFRAMHASSDDGPLRAVRNFERAIELDPNFTAAYVRLAQCYFFMGGSGPGRLMTARLAVEKALALDPKVSEAHAMSASIRNRLDLNWRAGEEEMKLALRLNPRSPDTLYESALGLAVLGRREGAVETLEKALRLDPESASIARLRHAGHVYTWAHEYDKGIQKYNEVIRNNPGATRRIENFIQQACLGKRDYLEAIRHGRNAFPSSEEDATRAEAQYDALERAFREGGESAYWAQELVFENTRTDPNHLMRLAAVYARLGRVRDAVQTLARAYNETPTDFAFNINTNPAFDSLRSDPDFRELESKLWLKR